MRRKTRVTKSSGKATFKAGTLAESKKYSQYEDILKAAFPNPDTEITYDQADKVISDYLGRRV